MYSRMNIMSLISKSKIRQKIILLFAYNSGKEYYINEIARLVNTSAGNARRELERLIESGFLVKEKKGNALYFWINNNNPLLPDLKNIIDKTIGLNLILSKELCKTKGIDYAFLFGSYVKGDFKADSDVDLYVIGEITDKELYPKIRSAEKKIYREINYHLATSGEFKEKLKKSFFHKEILENYLLVMGGGDEFKKFIG